jgi:hypothetical protein
MSRKERARTRPDRLATLLETGAHGPAARAARTALAGAEASADDRSRAGAVLASLAPEPAAVIAGLVGVVIAVAVTVWMVLGGAR